MLAPPARSPSVPAVGFGFGDCVILELLRDEKLLPVLKAGIDDVVIPWSDAERAAAVQVAAKLRARGRRVDIVLGKGKKMKWCYSYADRVCAERVVLIGPDEWARGVVRVKVLGAPADAPAAEKEFDQAFADL